MNAIETVIAEYVHNIESEEYIDRAMTQHGVQGLVQQAVRWVNSPEPDRVGDALLFIRDLGIGVFRAETTEAFRNELPNSGLFEALERCLHVPYVVTRLRAIYTFGKLCFAENAPVLIRAFNLRRELDPLIVPRLLQEVLWLDGDVDAHWHRLHRLLASSHELTRWAALSSALETRDEDRSLSRSLRLLDQCIRDASPLIRAEARHAHAVLDRMIRLGAMNKQQRQTARELDKSERRNIESLRPKIIFGDLEIRFTKMHGMKPDYRVEDVLMFVEQFR